ncbi:hypothetical protein [Erythrobacter litoralis]|uniref:hypothetical protein n=1 Tax=Erythrobacter litoralis TaxID=39960 RepID=UPI0018F8A9A7|nr:hypothetical protein [Erythrobacter litoralis]
MNTKVFSNLLALEPAGTQENHLAAIQQRARRLLAANFSLKKVSISTLSTTRSACLPAIIAPPVLRGAALQ